MSFSASELRAALADLADGLLPGSLRQLRAELDRRVLRIPNRINEFGFDPYGLSPEFVRRSLLPAALIYRYYFRVETRGIERVPAGRVLLVANHSGQLPFDGAMLDMAMLLEAEPPRKTRPMAEYWVPRLPWFGVAATRGGAMVGTPRNCAHMLENGECVMAFPEGVRGVSKPFSQRYQLQRFGLGFMRLALETDTPIVPIGIVGAEEQNPGITNLERVARLLGTPSFPLTLTFPWLGPLGLLPLPVKYHILFGEPLRLQGDPAEGDAALEERVDQVRVAIGGLLAQGLRERRGIFT